MINLPTLCMYRLAPCRFTGASILRITYGYAVEKEDDELVQLVDRAVEEFSLATAPGAFYADMLPIRSFDFRPPPSLPHSPSPSHVYPCMVSRCELEAYSISLA